eukprot:scaffold248458_cov28-Tisochrysis_lutea.AAC.1
MAQVNNILPFPLLENVAVDFRNASVTLRIKPCDCGDRAVYTKQEAFALSRWCVGTSCVASSNSRLRGFERIERNFIRPMPRFWLVGHRLTSVELV